jgi:hypothetical protein
MILIWRGHPETQNPEPRTQNPEPENPEPQNPSRFDEETGNRNTSFIFSLSHGGNVFYNNNFFIPFGYEIKSVMFLFPVSQTREPENPEPRTAKPRPCVPD